MKRHPVIQILILSLASTFSVGCNSSSSASGRTEPLPPSVTQNTPSSIVPISMPRNIGGGHAGDDNSTIKPTKVSVGEVAYELAQGEYTAEIPIVFTFEDASFITQADFSRPQLPCPVTAPQAQVELEQAIVLASYEFSIQDPQNPEIRDVYAKGNIEVTFTRFSGQVS